MHMSSGSTMARVFVAGLCFASLFLPGFTAEDYYKILVRLSNKPLCLVQSTECVGSMRLHQASIFHAPCPTAPSRAKEHGKQATMSNTHPTTAPSQKPIAGSTTTGREALGNAV